MSQPQMFEDVTLDLTEDLKDKIIDLEKGKDFVEVIEEVAKEKKEDIIKDELPKIPKDTHEIIYCRLCGRGFKAITANHLIAKHQMSLSEYITMFPDAPVNYFGILKPSADEVPKGQKQTPNKFKNVTKASEVVRDDTYVDKQGCTRDKKTKRLVKGTKGLNPAGAKKLTPVEQFLRHQIGWNGEQVFKFLYAVVTYNQKKERHKLPYYKPSDQLAASRLLLEYTFGKPTTFQKVEKTVNKLSVQIGLRLPADVDPEDF